MMDCLKPSYEIYRSNQLSTDKIKKAMLKHNLAFLASSNIF